MDDWPFADPRDAEAITLDRILRGESPLRLAVRDDDGSWQFLDGEQVFEADAVLVTLFEMLQFDPSLSELADLTGWSAWREAPGSPGRVPRATRPPNDEHAAPMSADLGAAIRGPRGLGLVRLTRRKPGAARRGTARAPARTARVA